MVLFPCKSREGWCFDGESTDQNQPLNCLTKSSLPGLPYDAIPVVVEDTIAWLSLDSGTAERARAILQNDVFSFFFPEELVHAEHCSVPNTGEVYHTLTYLIII